MSFLPLPEVSEGINPVLPEEMVMDSPEAVPLQDKTGSSHDAPRPCLSTHKEVGYTQKELLEFNLHRQESRTYVEMDIKGVG